MIRVQTKAQRKFDPPAGVAHGVRCNRGGSLGCEGADLKGGIAMGGRLDFMSGHEYAISALEDLPVVEQHVASGGRLGELDVRDLRDIHARIARLGAIDHKPVTDPAMDDIGQRSRPEEDADELIGPAIRVSTGVKKARRVNSGPFIGSCERSGL
jgi:hypothetical protein